MGRKCNVLDCPSDSKRSEDNGVTFHKMPFHPDLRPKWIELCRIPEDRQLNKVIYVCSRHFRRTDFCNFKGTKYMLKQGALPSVFPWTRCLIKLPNGGKADDATNSDSTEIKCEPVDADSKSYDDIDISNIKEEPMEEEDEVVPEQIEEEKIPKIKKETDTIKPKIKKEKKEIIVKKESDTPPPPPSSIPPKSRDDTQICISFFPGTRIEANDFNDKWYPASILEVDYEENEVFVEFDKHLNRANEWIPMDSSRLRPYVGSGTADFVVGEKCMATWMNSCSKFPATIKKVLDGDNYEVLFDDGFTKILKHCKLSKIKDPNKIPLPPKAPVPHAAPLFEPVVGSKEDRRERKRKINVAQLFGRKKSKSDDMRFEDDEKYDLPELNKSIPALAYGDGEEWTCRWLNGEPIGLESTLESPDGTRRSIIVPDHRLPTGWEKHLTQRLYGNSAGKWDSILVNPDGKKFANRQQLKVWFEENKLDYNIENFDFSLHINRAKKLGLYEITDPELTAANLKPNQQQKPGFPKLKGTKTPKNASSKNTNMAQSPATPDIPVLEPEIEEDNNPPEVSLKIIHENDSYKCPIEGCGKNFRKENLAQMHIKHYHPEYSKLIGSTPNVADLAYARTVGEHIDEIVPPKLKPAASPLIDKDKSLKTESTSKPKSTIKVLTPKTVPKEDKSIERIPNFSGASPSLNNTKPNSKDSEIIRLLNSEPKTKMDSIFDSVEIHKQLTADEPKPSSDRYPEIKLRDLLIKSEPIPYKKDEFNRSFGIKTLLPVNRRNSDDNKNDTETDQKLAERNKIGKKRQSSDKRRQSFKYDTDDMSDYCEADSHSQDSFNVKTPVEMIAAPPLQEGQVIIEGGEVIRLVHMRSEEIINCTCGITEEDGLMIQCELCLCWQHAHCNNIAKENEVPEKYICKICKNPQRMRQSKKYIHDQDWLKQGVLATANYHSKDAKVLEKRFEMLRKSHELSGCMVELNEYLHNLRVKLNIAGSKDHPKLYLWAKSWDKPLPNNTLNLQKPESKDDDFKEDSFNRSFASSDHSYIKSTTAFSEMALKTMLEPLEDLKNEIENPDLNIDIKLPVDTKIKSQSELISILEDDEPSTSTTDVNKMDTDENTSFPKIDLNSIIVNNLTDKIESKNEVLIKEEALNSITSGILSTTSLDLALAQLSGVVAAPEVGSSHLLIPQPEAVIDSTDCKLNLLDHVAHYQNLIETRLNSVEAVLFELEGEDSNPLPEDDDNDSKTKQTLQMLMRDLGTMREIAAINN